MIKLAALLKRKNSMSIMDFDQYWRDTRGRLFPDMAEFTSRAQRYVQGHIIEPAYDGMGMVWQRAGYDGVAEVWFDTLNDINASFSDPYFVEHAIDDKNFVDNVRTQLFVLNETEIAAPMSSRT